MSESLIDALGFTAATFTTGCLVPQILKVMRTRSAGDLSWTMLWMGVVGWTLWILYGSLIKNAPTMAANSIAWAFGCMLALVKLQAGPEKAGEDYTVRLLFTMQNGAVYPTKKFVPFFWRSDEMSITAAITEAGAALGILEANGWCVRVGPGWRITASGRLRLITDLSARAAA